MTDYFDELNCEPIPEGDTQNHQTLLMIRFMQQNGFLTEEFEAEITAPPASKEVVSTLFFYYTIPNSITLFTHIKDCFIVIIPLSLLSFSQWVSHDILHANAFIIHFRQVKNLQQRYVGADDEKCSICLRPNNAVEADGEGVDGASATTSDVNLFKILPCHHEFHATCILPWLEKVSWSYIHTCTRSLRPDNLGIFPQL